jgi:protease PrsW
LISSLLLHRFDAYRSFPEAVLTSPAPTTILARFHKHPRAGDDVSFYLQIVFVLAIAPGVFWLWYFYRKDKFEPEPLNLIRNVFLVGALGVVPAFILEMPFGIFEKLLPGIGPYLGMVVVAPVVEETTKFLVVRWMIYKNPEFDEPLDGVVYAAAAALGFASAENLGYVMGQIQHGAGAVATVGVVRAFLSVPGHALFSSMWGYALGFAKFSDPARGRTLVVRGLLLAMILHGTFNFLCFLGPYWALGMLIFVPIMWRMAHTRIRKALEASPHEPPVRIE